MYMVYTVQRACVSIRLSIAKLKPYSPLVLHMYRVLILFW